MTITVTFMLKWFSLQTAEISWKKKVIGEQINLTPAIRKTKRHQEVAAEKPFFAALHKNVDTIMLTQHL